MNNKVTIGCCIVSAVCFVGLMVVLGKYASRVARDYLQKSTATLETAETLELRRQATELIYGTTGHVDNARARQLLRDAWEKGDKLAGMRLCLLDTSMPDANFDWEEHQARYYDCATAVSTAAAEENAEALHLEGMNQFVSTRNFDVALGLAQRSAAQGYHPAMLLAGIVIENGVTSGKGSYDEAAAWFEQAAAAGNVIAGSYLAGLYMKEDWTGRNPARALELLAKAEAHEESLGLYLLGQASAEGRIVPQDFAKAISYYERSANAGYSSAFVALGDMYRDGLSGEQSNVEAARWYRLAADLYNTEAVERLRSIGEPVAEYEEWVQRRD